MWRVKSGSLLLLGSDFLFSVCVKSVFSPQFIGPIHKFHNKIRIIARNYKILYSTVGFFYCHVIENVKFLLDWNVFGNDWKPIYKVCRYGCLIAINFTHFGGMVPLKNVCTIFDSGIEQIFIGDFLQFMKQEAGYIACVNFRATHSAW